MELQNYVSATIDALKPAESVNGEPTKLVAFLHDLRTRTWKDIVGVLSEWVQPYLDSLLEPHTLCPTDPYLPLPNNFVGRHPSRRIFMILSKQLIRPLSKAPS